MESNYTEAELEYNDHWDKWGHHKDTSNKDLTTCFDLTSIFSQQEWLRLRAQENR